MARTSTPSGWLLEPGASKQQEIDYLSTFVSDLPADSYCRRMLTDSLMADFAFATRSDHPYDIHTAVHDATVAAVKWENDYKAAASHAAALEKALATAKEDLRKALEYNDRLHHSLKDQEGTISDAAERLVDKIKENEGLREQVIYLESQLVITKAEAFDVITRLVEDL